jgi:TatD DNase family protein
MYIDIHTHNLQPVKDGFSIKNFIYGKETIDFSQKFSVGIHPWYLNVDIETFKKQLISIQNHPNFLAIGEAGLDLRQEILTQNPLKKQKDYFQKQIVLAEQIQKPLIIHCVRCIDQLLSLKKKHQPKQPWIIHGFEKNKKPALQLLEAGFYLSFGASLYKSKTNRQAFSVVPNEKIFLETDEQNKYSIIDVYNKAAEVKDMQAQEIQFVISQNFNQVFLKK